MMRFKDNLIAIIQARMSSTRLPGKVLFNLCGKTVLNHVVDRVSRCHMVDKVVVATTDLEIDEAIIDECYNLGVDCFRGSSDDVLSRYYQAAVKFSASNIVRITSDCPVMSTNTLNEMANSYVSNNYDYLSNTNQRTFPRGLDIELFTFAALERACVEASKDYEKEHVTPYIYHNPSIFRIGHYLDQEDNSRYRWTLDTQEDWELIKQIYHYLYQDNHIFDYQDILALHANYPKLIEINRKVEQKKLGIK